MFNILDYRTHVKTKGKILDLYTILPVVLTFSYQLLHIIDAGKLDLQTVGKLEAEIFFR